MSSGSSGSDTGYTEGSQDDGYRKVYGFTTRLNRGQQGKHIPGHNAYMPGRSIFKGSLSDAQELLDHYAGTGQRIGRNKERVDFHQIIGTFKQRSGECSLPTTMGIIHYGSKGAHIVPSNPKSHDDNGIETTK